MDDFLNKIIIFDLYGSILNENQRNVYEYHIVYDLSFNEIGIELGLSRQDCYDLFVRADKKLLNLENKLKLQEKFSKIENYAKKINQLSTDSKIKILSKKIINLIINGGKNGSKNSIKKIGTYS